MAECVSDAVSKGWPEFPHVGCASGCDKTLFAADGGERVGEVRALLSVVHGSGMQAH